jgi:hypothetical protein
VRDGQGVCGFLCPPGHPNHEYVLQSFIGPGCRVALSWQPITAALEPGFDGSADVTEEARRILDAAPLACSELWVRSVYGYFRSMYAPESGTRDVSEAVCDPVNELPAERHLAVLCIREYFPDHEPRTELIRAPGYSYGYGMWPCVKCDTPVQYAARRDALCVVTVRGSVWCYDAECAEGGSHALGSA